MIGTLRVKAVDVFKIEFHTSKEIVFVVLIFADLEWWVHRFGLGMQCSSQAVFLHL